MCWEGVWFVLWRGGDNDTINNCNNINSNIIDNDANINVGMNPVSGPIISPTTESGQIPVKSSNPSRSAKVIFSLSSNAHTAFLHLLFLAVLTGTTTTIIITMECLLKHIS